jgi:hypothetical protein
MTERWWLPWVILLAGVLLYPAVVVAEGAPRFPHAGECIHPAEGEGEVEAVFGRFRDRAEAAAVRKRALASGFREIEVVRDGCGFLRVVLDEVPSLAVGRDFAREARRVGFTITLERPPE